MGRAKIKKKSTFIDMTAMSDVTVLLLTFFMLTSTFVKKEPVQVTTPGHPFPRLRYRKRMFSKYWSIRTEKYL